MVARNDGFRSNGRSFRHGAQRGAQKGKRLWRGRVRPIRQPSEVVPEYHLEQVFEVSMPRPTGFKWRPTSYDASRELADEGALLFTYGQFRQTGDARRSGARRLKRALVFSSSHTRRHDAHPHHGGGYFRVIEVTRLAFLAAPGDYPSKGRLGAKAGIVP